MRPVMPPPGAGDTITPAIRPASICSRVLEFSRAGSSARAIEAEGVGSGGGGGGGGFDAGSVRLAPECAHPTTSVAMRAMDHFMGTSQARRCKRGGERALGAPLPFVRAGGSRAAPRIHPRAEGAGLSRPKTPPPPPPPRAPTTSPLGGPPRPTPPPPNPQLPPPPRSHA